MHAQLCPILCNPIDCSPPDSCVHGILQVRILEWVVISSSGYLSDTGIKPMNSVSPALAGRSFPTWEALFYIDRMLN